MAKPAGRPRRYIGALELENAEALFRQSVEDGSPNYRYVAMAIGAEPLTPPAWAVLACLHLKGTTEKSAGSSMERPDGDVLDEAIRIIARHEDRMFEIRMAARSLGDGANIDRRDRFPVKRAIEQAYFALNDGEEIGESNYRRIRRLWDDEQRRTVYKGPTPIPMDDDSILTTFRINRVLSNFEDAKIPDGQMIDNNPQRTLVFTRIFDAMASNAKNISFFGL